MQSCHGSKAWDRLAGSGRVWGDVGMGAGNGALLFSQALQLPTAAWPLPAQNVDGCGEHELALKKCGGCLEARYCSRRARRIV